MIHRARLRYASRERCACDNSTEIQQNNDLREKVAKYYNSNNNHYPRLQAKSWKSQRSHQARLVDAADVREELRHRHSTARNYFRIEIASGRRIDTGFPGLAKKPSRSLTETMSRRFRLSVSMTTTTLAGISSICVTLSRTRASERANERTLAPMNVGADFSIKRVPRRGCSTAYRDQWHACRFSQGCVSSATCVRRRR